MSRFVSLSGKTSPIMESVLAAVLKGRWDGLLKRDICSTLTSANVNLLVRQLSLYDRGPSFSFSFFKWAESIPKYKHSLESSWTMIQILTEYKHFRVAQKLLDKIAHKDFLSSPSVLSSLGRVHDDPDVNSHVLSWLVIFYANLKMTHDAIQVFEHMKVHGLKPHSHACTVLLNSLAKDMMTDMVWKIYKKMTKLGVVPNIQVYNVLIHACCKSQDVEKAESLLSEMESRSVFPDLYTYNTLISLYCKKGMHYEALSVQERIQSAGMSPDIVTYNSLIYGFCKEGRMREAVRLLREIKGASPNHVTYTTLIDGYCRANDLEEALRICKVMEARGLSPGVVTYNSILRKFCEEGRIRDANKLLNEMSEKNVEPDNITCNTLINAYCKIGDMRSALKVKSKMVDAGLKLDGFTYKALIHGFCKVRDMDSAKEFLFSMLDAGYSPSYSCYSWVVDGYIDQENEEAVIGILDEFVTRDSFIEVSVFRGLIRRLCKRERINCAEKIFNIMQAKGISGDSVVYTSLAYASWKDGKSDVASELLNEMYKRRLMVTLKIYRCFNASYEGDGNILRSFWDHAVERGVLSKNIVKEIQLMNLHT